MNISKKRGYVLLSVTVLAGYLLATQVSFADIPVRDPNFFILQDSFFAGFRGPLVADLDRDGIKEIYTEDTGGLQWLLDWWCQPLPGWPLEIPEGYMYGTGSAADMDRDGDLEIVVPRTTAPGGGLINLIQTFDERGNLVSSFEVELGLITFAPILADLDGDCVPEIIIQKNQDSGRIHIFNQMGVPLPGWPVPMEDFVHSATAAVGDINGDGSLEIVIARTQRDVFAYSADGRQIARYETLGEMNTAPALGDIDGDGELEIVAASLMDGHVYAWNTDGSFVGGVDSQWPVATNESFNPVALGDIDSDGMPEIIAVSRYGSLFAWNHDGTEVDSDHDGRTDFPVEFDMGLFGQGPTPIIADIDPWEEGVEIIVMTRDSRLYVFTHDGRLVPGFPMDLPQHGDRRPRSSDPVVSDLNGDGWHSELVIARGNEIRMYLTHGRADQIEWGSRNHDPQQTRNYNYRPGDCIPPPQKPLFDPREWRFEVPADEWKITGQWKRTVDGVTLEPEGHSPKYAMWFGDYDRMKRIYGSLISPPIVLPEGATLTFSSWEETEGGTNYDTRKVYLNNTRYGQVLVRQCTGDRKGWYPVTVDISEFSGEKVTIEFEFDSIDGLYNDYRGWYVDDVKVHEEPSSGK